MGAAAPGVRAQAPVGRAVADDPLGGYLADLEKVHRLPAETIPLEKLDADLRAAEDLLVRGDARAATSLLFGIVESPRARPWKNTPAFANAEFALGRALMRGGARISAERYLLRVLARGVSGPYFVPAQRALVDLALDTRDYQRLARVIEGVLPPGPTPRDAESEVAYLLGRAAYDAADWRQAARQFAVVHRTSRLYPGAAYFRGLIAARDRRWGEARGAFCEIAGQGDRDKLSFNVDARYFGLKDVARLALGRLAHEREKYDEAYYFYFSIPEDSDRLAEALYEAAWSMFQKGDYGPARAFIEQFSRVFPESPLRVEVAILMATIDLKSCAFDRARAASADILRTLEPLQARLARIREDPGRQAALVRNLLAPPEKSPPGTGVDGDVVALLKLDVRFRSLYEMIRGINVDLAESSASLGLWQALGASAAPGSQNAPQQAVASVEAAQLLHETEALAEEAGDARGAMEGQIDRLLLAVSLAAHPPAGAGPFAAEAQAAEAISRRLAGLRERAMRAAGGLAGESLADLDQRLRSTLRQARLVQIDAAVGKKKKLEIEIANLYAGKLPAYLFNTLRTEGALGDDEEYWPFEGEYWSDEYVNYK